MTVESRVMEEETPVARQRGSEYVHEANNKHIRMEKLLEAVFSIRSIPRPTDRTRESSAALLPASA
jgi:hypothetical protein